MHLNQAPQFELSDDRYDFQTLLGSGGMGDANPLLIRQAFRLEWLSIAWMVIEGAVAIGSGIVAHSLLLVAFGIKEGRETWQVTSAASARAQDANIAIE